MEIENKISLSGVIPGGIDAWGRMVPQFLPYDFSGNEDSVSAIQYCNGWNDAGGYWLEHATKLRIISNEILAALELMLLIHDEPSGFGGKFGKELDIAIEEQQEKIDRRISIARNAIKKAKASS